MRACHDVHSISIQSGILGFVNANRRYLWQSYLPALFLLHHALLPLGAHGRFHDGILQVPDCPLSKVQCHQGWQVQNYQRMYRDTNCLQHCTQPVHPQLFGREANAVQRILLWILAHDVRNDQRNVVGGQGRTVIWSDFWPDLGFCYGHFRSLDLCRFDEGTLQAKQGELKERNPSQECLSGKEQDQCHYFDR